MNRVVLYIIYIVISLGLGICGYILSPENKIEYAMSGVIVGLVISLVICSIFCKKK